MATTDGSTIIGESILISGSLNGDEDLTVRGRVEGTLTLTKLLVVEPTGIVKAEVQVKNCVIAGVVVGNVTATDKVDIRDNGSVDGDIVSPRVAIAEGAHFRGSVDMQRKGAAAPAKPAQPQPAPAPQQAAQPSQAAANPQPVFDHQHGMPELGRLDRRPASRRAAADHDQLIP